MKSARDHLLQAWLAAVLGPTVGIPQPASSDASFRRYWRVDHRGDTLIVMDAPPAAGGLDGFVRMSRWLRGLGLNVPRVLAQQPDQGFLLLSDLGSRHYLDVLDEATADRLYGDAIDALIRLQLAAPPPDLPAYDGPFLRRELDLFGEWLLAGLLRLTPSAAEAAMLEEVSAVLVANALEQPVVCVHRDFHSRNLMWMPTDNPGILDFQDAVVGPVTYDLVSLLKDCYVAWPRQRMLDWALGYFERAVRAGLLRQAHEPSFLRWLDLMGVQRHLKAAGIFARLALRDGKTGYLGDLPRTLGYVVDAAERYPALESLGVLVAERVLPRLSECADTR